MHCSLSFLGSQQMMALKEMEMIEILTFGYLREFENVQKLSHKIPTELKNVIIVFYPRDKFKFMNRKILNAESYTIEDNGNKFNHKARKWVTVQIGDFIDINDKVIHTLKLKYHGNDINAQSGIGFITEDFEVFSDDIWYYMKGKPCSFIFTNGYYITNNIFGSVNGNLTSSKFLNSYRGWYNSGDIMMIKINTDKMKAIIWNSTPPQYIAAREDINVDEEYDDYKGYYFKYNLPRDKPVALAVEAGISKHSIEIIDHKVEYIS